MRRFKRFKRRKRHTNWVPGVNFGESLEYATISLALNTPSAGVNSFTVALTDDTDLQKSGGENAVIARLVGRLHPFGATRDTTPLPAFMRWAVFVADDMLGTIALPDLFQNTVLESENIIQSGSVLVSGLNCTLASNDTLGDMSSRIIEIDTSARRRLNDDHQVYITFQFAPKPDAAGATITAFKMSGFLRLLLLKALP